MITNMRHKLITALLAMAAICLQATAQDDIQFGVGKPDSGTKMSKEVKELLTTKVSQILNRNSAAAGGDFGAFVVTPTLTLGEESTTSGLARNFSVVTGELTLTARNRDDRSEYYSVTVPLKVTNKNTSTDPLLALAKSIKPTDAAYVRFIRTARENISKSFEKDCEEVVSRAKGIYASGRLEDAMSLLLAIPSSSSCNDEVLELLEGMGALKAQKERELADKEEARRNAKASATDPNEGVRKDKPIDDKGDNISDNDNSDDSDGNSDDTSDQSDMRVYISNPEWELKVDSIKWVEINRNVVCSIKVRNTKRTANNMYASPMGAITCDGDQFNNIDTPKVYNDFPEGVWIKLQFNIHDMKQNPKCLARFKFKLNNNDNVFEINNVKVE